MESHNPTGPQQQAAPGLPKLETQSQQPSSTRSVEVDVQRLADIRASLQDIQRRKSASPSSTGAAKLSAMRQNAYTSSIPPSQHSTENMYQPLHAASAALFSGRQQPFTQRDLNKEVKVYTAIGMHVSIVEEWNAIGMFSACSAGLGTSTSSCHSSYSLSVSSLHVVAIWCSAIRTSALMQAIKNSSKALTPPVGHKQHKAAGSPGAALAKSPQPPSMPSFQVHHRT